MPSLIVVRIIPQKPTDPQSFSSALAAGGGLQITLTTLAFTSVDNKLPGANSVTATYIPLTPSGGWTVSDGSVFPAGAVISFNLPPYPAGLTGGIIQQVDYVPSPNPLVEPLPVAELQAVATAVLQAPWTAPQLENISVTATRGTESIALDVDYYVLTPNSAAVPNLSIWAPDGGNTQADPWAQLPANLYLSLPPAPPSNPAAAFQMPSDGTAPPFDTLLTAVNAVLALDPRSATVTATVVAPGAAAGATQLPFGAAPAGVTMGMAVSSTGTGIVAGTTVLAISGGAVTLSQAVGAAGVDAGTVISFTPSLSNLTLNQCQNIAYKLLWAQQPPLPTPPSSDTIEELYTNPPNSGSLLSGSSSVNQLEGDRQQFEAQLKSYYAVPNANADRLTTYVYALSAAVACEQMSLAATQALIRFPSQPGSAAMSSSSNQSVILTALDMVAGPAHFGVPAAYFYAIAGSTPSSRTTKQRYTDATGDQLAQLLSELTAAIGAGTILDGEGFVISGVAGTINAAQAARRICALGVPAGSSTALAPLNTIALATNQATPSGNILNFSSAAVVHALLGTDAVAVSGQGIPGGASVTAATGTTVTLSSSVLLPVQTGTTIIFTPAYPNNLSTLVTDWLDFPSVSAGSISSQSYQPGDDDSQFWPAEATAQPQAFLQLILCALTDGYIIPAPFSIALACQIYNYLATVASPPTVATLAQVSQAQWTALFKLNPTWLPPQPGGTGAQITAFIKAIRALFPVGAGGPISAINLATSAQKAVGSTDNVLTFAATTGVQPGWSVSSLLTVINDQGDVVPAIPAGALVSTNDGSVTQTTVTMNVPVNGTVPEGTNITFRPTVRATENTSLPQFQAPATDWLAACLKAYNPNYTFGQGITNPAALATAAANVFANDPSAQAWLVQALTTIDALCAIVTAAGETVTSTAGPEPLAGALGFSIVEALYSCGFCSAASITALSEADFAQALIGSPAFSLAGPIHDAAAKSNPPPPAPKPAEPGFHPINPDGSLTNCIPPPCLSPLGPVAYLHELLQLSMESTYDNPFPSTPTERDPIEEQIITVHAEELWEQAGKPSGGPTDFWLHAETALQAQGKISIFPPVLGTAIAQRRGPLGNLTVSSANLETPIPLIDIVNECLEFMGAAATPSGGIVYDTAADKLADFPLCQWDDRPPDPKADLCYEPARIFPPSPNIRPRPIRHLPIALSNRLSMTSSRSIFPLRSCPIRSLSM